MQNVLRVESVSKCFSLQRNRPFTIKESLIWWSAGRRSTKEVFWALKDVSFTVGKGRCLGIIGHNGAGKSTLLRLLCGVGRPTKGRIYREGYASGLLELGSGWHPELTGRENILTAGILNGLTARQVLKEQDEIISFAELEEFIDEPVRTYSNGMYLRLAFSTAIHFDPDVLMIDEILAVGDSRFQQKCIDKLHAFRKAGKTLVMVSHSTDLVRSLCEEVLVIEEGRIVSQTAPENAIECFYDLMRQRSEKRAAQLSEGKPPNVVVERGNRLGTQEVSMSAVRLCDGLGREIDTLQSGEALTIIIEYSMTRRLPDIALNLGIYSETDVKCFETVIPSTRGAFGPLTRQGSLKCYLPKLPLLAGRYYVVVGLYPTDWSYIYDYHWQMHILHVMDPQGPPAGTSGVVSVHPVWSVDA